MRHEERERQYRQLQQQQLFRGVSLDAVEYFFDTFTEQCVPAGSVILQRDQENRFLYLIVEGEVHVHPHSLTQPPLHRLGPGECFGEMALIDDSKASAYVVAASDCRYVMLDEDALWGMVHRSHGIARNLLFILTQRVRTSNDMISANLERLQRWEAFALSDALTGLNNRRWLDESIERIMHRAWLEQQPLTAIMLDVDHFKHFNDTWGHLAGDQALRTLASLIREHLRARDLVARYGGEEFLILLPRTALQQGEHIANRLRRAIAETPCGDHSEKVLPAITVSMGLSSLNLKEAQDPLIERADQALYAAKQAGRNRVMCQKV